MISLRDGDKTFFLILVVLLMIGRTLYNYNTMIGVICKYVKLVNCL
jgi:hypothetical protein